MALKKLNQFLMFDWEGFAKGKALQVIGLEEWKDYETKVHMGTKVTAAITRDGTHYKLKDGETVSNAYEKLTIKVRKDVQIPVGAYIMLVNAVCTVYGDYRNQLSITADDIRVLTPNK